MSFKGALGKVVGGAVGSVFGPVGAYIGSELGSSLGDDSAQRRALKQQQNYQLGLWNMQNEYNSPAQQMERLKEAGLNPNLAYGNLASGAAGSVGSSGRLNVYQADAVNLANAYQDLRQKDAMNEQIRLQTNIARHMWPVDVDVKNMNFMNLKEQNDILEETLKQEKLRTLGMAADLAAQQETSSHKTGWSYRWSRNIGEWINAVSPFVQSGADAGASYLRWHGSR